jgi:excisionase family DNA binding protein
MEASPKNAVATAGDDVFRASPADEAQTARLDEVLTRSEAAAADLELLAPGGDRLAIPDGLRRVLARVAHEMARGNGVVVVPVHHELTTHEAAALLHVSRPHLIRMLDDGRLPYRRVGAHRRIRFDDVTAYRAREEARREALLTRIARESQELGLEF